MGCAWDRCLVARSDSKALPGAQRDTGAGMMLSLAGGQARGPMTRLPKIGQDAPQIPPSPPALPHLGVDALRARLGLEAALPDRRLATERTRSPDVATPRDQELAHMEPKITVASSLVEAPRNAGGAGSAAEFMGEFTKPRSASRSAGASVSNAPMSLTRSEFVGMPIDTKARIVHALVRDEPTRRAMVQGLVQSDSEGVFDALFRLWAAPRPAGLVGVTREHCTPELGTWNPSANQGLGACVGRYEEPATPHTCPTGQVWDAARNECVPRPPTTEETVLGITTAAVQGATAYLDYDLRVRAQHLAEQIEANHAAQARAALDAQNAGAETSARLRELQIQNEAMQAQAALLAAQAQAQIRDRAPPPAPAVPTWVWGAGIVGIMGVLFAASQARRS